jgi:hypothetical protein
MCIFIRSDHPPEVGLVLAASICECSNYAAFSPFLNLLLKAMPAPGSVGDFMLYLMMFN